MYVFCRLHFVPPSFVPSFLSVSLLAMPPAIDKFQLSDVYSPSACRWMMAVMDVTCGGTVCLGLLLIYLILNRSPRGMETHKFYLLTYTCTCILLVLLLSALKPWMLSPLLVFCFVGWLASVSVHGIVAGTVVGVGLFVHLGCCYSVIVLERFLAMTKYAHLSRYLLLFFASTVLLSLLILAVAVFVALQDGVVASAELAKSFVTASIASSDEFIAACPNLVALNSSNIHLTPILLMCIVFGTQGLFSSVPLALTAVVARKHARKLNRRTRAVHRMLMTASFLQFSGFLAFMCVPMFAFLLFSILLRWHTPMQQVAFPMVNVFVLYDMVTIILVIKPYRSYVLRFLRMAHLGRAAHVLPSTVSETRV